MSSVKIELKKVKTSVLFWKLHVLEIFTGINVNKKTFLKNCFIFSYIVAIFFTFLTLNLEPRMCIDLIS